MWRSGRPRAAALTLAAFAAALGAGGGCLPSSLAARMILEPQRRALHETPETPYAEVEFPGDGVALRGWLQLAAPPVRGTIIYLHGRNQNRAAGIALTRKLVHLGYDVLAYDSRAHGISDGRYSTFGYYEKNDVSRAIDFLGAEHVVVVGLSLGAAVAIQAAAEDPRIAGVVAASSFSSMETVVRERLPGFVPEGEIRRTFRLVEERAHIRVKDVDAVAAARRVKAPVLLLHGRRDQFTPLAHSTQIYDALRGPRALVEIPGAGHGDVLTSAEAWPAIQGWLASLGPEPESYAARLERSNPRL